MIKYSIILILCLVSLNSCGSYDPPESKNTAVDHGIWDQLLKKYVSDEGWVNYEAWQEDREALKKYLEILSDNPPDESLWTTEQKLAYWINAYNAFTVELILEHYPLESITDLHPSIYIPGVNTVWHKKFFKIGGVETSLDEIEHKILRVRFEEPRIHFAIVCASYSCPKLRNEAYIAAQLEQQLTEQATGFINDPLRNQLSEDEVKLSKIFKWFKGDFKKKGSLIDYLNQYASIKISTDATVKHLDYNWDLNEQR